VEHLRTVASALAMADVRAQVMFSTFTDFENMNKFKPDPRHEGELNAMLNQLISWSTALKTIR